MALAPHQKVTIDLASLRSKLVALRAKALSWLSDPHLDRALLELEAAEKSMAIAHTELAKLPPEYSPHASKIVITDIKVNGFVCIREAKQKDYESLLDGKVDAKLKVIAVGQPFVTVELATGVRVAVKRGDLVTIAQ